MMRIAHFVQRYPPALGGSEAYFARLSRYLAAADEQVSVFTTTALDLEAFWSPRGRCLEPGITQEDGVRVHRYGLCRWFGRRYLLKALSLVPHRFWQCLTLPCNPIAWRMWTGAAGWHSRGTPHNWSNQDAPHDWHSRGTHSFDVVHATAFPYAWPIACGLRLARRLRVPFVLTPFLHLGNPEDPHDRTRQVYLSPALLMLIRAADIVFVQTGVERDALRNTGIPERKLVRLGMGVDVEECSGGHRESVRRAWGVNAGEVVVGHLANNSVEKGTVDLLRAADHLWQQGRRFHLVLAGPEMPNFQRFWESYGPVGRVRRLGVLTEQQKRDFFAGIDLFALPSRSDSFGLVLLEAWANRIPNVAYRAGGVAEVIRHNLDGLLVRCGAVEELAEAIGQLIEHEEHRRRLGQAGFDRLRHEFCWQHKLEQVHEVYTDWVERNRVTAPDTSTKQILFNGEPEATA
jgi:glycosyltransferase involved in cell wall biosynthesis